MVGNLGVFLTDRVPKAQRAAVVAGGVQLTNHIRSNIGIPAVGGSAKTHDAWLRSEDHPYAKRHPEIQIASGRRRNAKGQFSNGGGSVNAQLQVHTVSGRLLSALVTGLETGSGRAGDAAFFVGLDTNKAPHARYVIEGTKILHKRDVLWATATDPAVKKDVRAGLVLEFKRVLRF